MAGAGISGVLAAMRDYPLPGNFVVVGLELYEQTRAALIDGRLTMVLSHPMGAFAHEAVTTMIRARKAGPDAGAQFTALNFEIYTPENV